MDQFTYIKKLSCLICLIWPIPPMRLSLKTHCQWSPWARYVRAVYNDSIAKGIYFIEAELPFFQMFGFLLYMSKYTSKEGSNNLFIPKVLFFFFQ